MTKPSTAVDQGSPVRIVNSVWTIALGVLAGNLMTIPVVALVIATLSG